MPRPTPIFPPDLPVAAIVGAGFSGTLLALHLLQAGPPDLRILLIEREGGFGRGLAYRTDDPTHLLNVRVGNMSAWPDQPDHLLKWLQAQPEGDDADAAAFITRETYGRYIAAQITAAVRQPDGAERLVLVHDAAVRVERGPRRLTLTFGMGRVVEVDAVALAPGNPPPGPITGLGLEGLPNGLYAPDPWAAKALEGLSPVAPIFLLGTGLTMVDVAMALNARGHRGPILALSRRGLSPHRHEGFTHTPVTAPTPPAVEVSRLLRRVRARAAEVGWRKAVDELRPATQGLWRQASPDQRRRFLRHLRPWWDIHRHRMAPAVADRIAAMRADSALTLVAGRVLDVQADDDAAVIRWRPRGASEADAREVRAERIINCTGIGALGQQPCDPLLRHLFESGAARPDPLCVGLDVDEGGRLIDAGGASDQRLYAVGPVTRGVFWEIIAVPDIRNQVARVAASLARYLVVGQGSC